MTATRLDELAGPLSLELRTGLAAVRDASRICRQVQSGLRQVEGKDGPLRTLESTTLFKPASLPQAKTEPPSDPVTVADFASQAVILHHIKGIFPEDPIVAEESSGMLRSADAEQVLRSVIRQVQSVVPDVSAEEVLDWIDWGRLFDDDEPPESAFMDRFWTLDPIDGTKGFLRGGQYAVALALIEGGRARVAVLGCPNLTGSSSDSPAEEEGIALVAIAGAGAYATSIRPDDSLLVPITVSSTPAGPHARFCESVEAAHTAQGAAAAVIARLDLDPEPVRLDSQAKYAVVARGDVELYLRLPRADYVERIWDHAAGALIVGEAGGRVSDALGQPLDFSYPPRLSSNHGIVASNGRIHDQVLDALTALR